MAGDDMKIIADRWMMESRQIVNWGSYDGYQEFRPNRQSPSWPAPANQANPRSSTRRFPCYTPMARPITRRPMRVDPSATITRTCAA